ncbi:ammonium transporter [Candidatus Igneacidithiobacillus taiwanensis]|uniref:ammonium transporter n=1 Tax=Candidatus Igneacidithiobacillus taiwanensis TaxID=1945924 RepID=UPI00289FE4E5|nr:ammonium transporter [Candidatus Igneacidithiobacillus taiwanensis]MCE5360860.1 ammonium transporter [Acidithiobacillus sp.]
MISTAAPLPGDNVFFLLMGAILVFAMHGGFAFLELGTVRRRSQVNALVKILSDFGISTIVYFFIGYHIAYGISFFGNVQELTGSDQGFAMVRFFFLLTFAAAVPAIISGGIAERARFVPQLVATAFLVGLVYPFYEGIVWNGNYGIQAWFTQHFGAPFHDFAGSVVVHAVGGWMALMAVWLLGPRRGRYGRDGSIHPMPPSNIPFLALGSWILIIGWFGFNVMSAQQLQTVQGLVALNSLMALVGGMLAALALGKGDPGFVHNGALAGLVAICAGSDVVQPIGALAIGAIAGAIFVYLFTFVQHRLRLDDVLGVWPLHGVCGAWGGIAVGIFGLRALGGAGGVSIVSQLLGTALGLTIAMLGSTVVYGLLRQFVGIRLDEEQEYLGADLAIHHVSAYPEEDIQKA